MKGGGYNLTRESISGSTVTAEETEEKPEGEEKGPDSLEELPGGAGGSEEAGGSEGTGDFEGTGDAAEMNPNPLAENFTAKGTDTDQEGEGNETGWVIVEEDASTYSLTIQTDDGMAAWLSHIMAMDQTKREAYLSKVKKLEICSGVTSIGESAFRYCTGLNEVIIPVGVTSIGESAFRYCTSLSKVTIPLGVTSIGESAFTECRMTEVTIPVSVTSIGKSAFSACSYLREITIPVGVTSISDYMFENCTALETVDIPSSVTSIGYSAFKECASLKTITIPPGVKVIGDGAFQNSGLTEITISSSVTEISGAAFLDCKSLRDVYMQGNIPPVLDPWNPFDGSGIYNQGSYRSIKVPREAWDAYYNAESWSKWHLYQYMEVYDLPKTPIETAKAAVEEAWGNITVTNNYRLDNLEADMAAAVRDALEKAGIDGENVTVDVPYDGYKQTFASANEEGSFSATVKIAIGGESAEITVERTFDLIACGTDWTLDRYGKLTVSSAAGLSDWDTNKDIFGNSVDVISAEIADEVTDLGSVFQGHINMTKITIPSGVTSIGRDAFSSCSSLTEITIPSGVTSIGDAAFGGCASLAEITIPSGVTSIGGAAFRGCDGLVEITIPSRVTEIGKKAFSNCESLERVIMLGSTPPKLLGTTSADGGSMNNFEFSKFHKDGTKGIKVPPGAVKEYLNKWGQWYKHIEGYVSPQGTVETAKKAAEEALEKLTVSNGTTAEKLHGGIEEAVREALAEAGIDSKTVTVTVEGFTKTEATEEAPGSVSATVKIESGGVSDTISVNKPIDKLPGTPEEKVEAAKKAAEEALKEITVSNGTTAEKLEDEIEKAVKDALTEAGIDSTDVAVTVEDFTKTEATGDAPGSVSATVKIESGGVSDTISVNKPIDKLPGTPEEKVEAAKKAAEEALKEITVSNGTTAEKLEDEIEKAVKDALAEAGMDNTDVTVTVEDFTKTEATGDAPGSVSATVKIESGGVSDTISVNKPIDKLPGTPEEKVEAAKKAAEEALKEITVSNGTTAEKLKDKIEKEVKDALEEAGMDSADVTVTVEDFTKTEATGDAPGSVSATVKIESGGVSDTISVNKPIDKIPGTPAEKVAAVKKAVEDALRDAIEEKLGGKKVTNENREEIAAQIAKEEFILGALTEALEASGVGMDDVGFGDVDIDADDLATAEKEGCIRVSVPITSTEDAGQSATAEILIPIERLDKDEAWAEETITGALTDDITITNETTLDEIQKVIEEALGDNATVDEIEQLEKEDATYDKPGKLKLKIKLTINGKTVYIDVNIPIGQLAGRMGISYRLMDYDLLDKDGNPCYKYTGTAIKPAIEIYNNETLLTEGKDYTVAYSNNTRITDNSRRGRLNVKGKGNFTGTARMINFDIIHGDIGQDTVHPTEMTVIANTKVSPVIMNGTKKLTTKDYKLEGAGLTNNKYASATAEGTTNILTVIGAGGYEGSSFEIRVKVIDKKDARKLAVNVDKNYKPVYDGSAVNLSGLFKKTADGEGAITVTDSKDKTKILREGTDFSVMCTSSLSDAGTVRFTLTGMGEYIGSVSKTFRISPLKVTDSAKFSVTFDEKDYEYRAGGTTVDGLKVTYLGMTDSEADDLVLNPGADYKVTYSNHKKVSGSRDAGLKITFLGNYKGSSAVSKTFKVVPAKLSAANTMVTVPDKIYEKAGRAYKSKPIVTVDGAAIKSSDYTVSYAWATESEAGDNTKYAADDKVRITIADDDAWAKVRVTVTPKETGSYRPAEGAVLQGEYYVRKKPDGAVNLSKARVILYERRTNREFKNLEYNGNTFYTPEGNDPSKEKIPDDPNAVYVRLYVGAGANATTVDPGCYNVVWTNAAAKGRATMVICGDGERAVGSITKNVNIKANNLKGKTLTDYVEKAVSSLKNIWKGDKGIF